MRAFAAGYYDNLRKMYAYLGVGFAEPRFVYSVSELGSSSTGKRKEDGTYFVHSSNNHIVPPIRPPGVGLLKWVVEVFYLFFWYTWFTAACFWIRPASFSLRSFERNAADAEEGMSDAGTAESLASYLTRIRLPSYYTNRYFLPLMSSVTTCTHDQLLSFPASDIIGYACATYRQPHYTITRGVKQAEDKLSDGLKVRLNTKVTGVKTLEDGRVHVSWTDLSHTKPEPTSSADQNQQDEKTYNRVIIATTPDVVGMIFAPLSAAMKTIPTTPVTALVHRDASNIEPISTSLSNNTRLRKRGIKSFDSSSSFSSDMGQDANMPLTAMHMLTDPSTAKTESIHEHPANVLVTTYALGHAVDEEKILHRVRFTRVLRSPRSRDLVNTLFTTPLSSSSHSKSRSESRPGLATSAAEKDISEKGTEEGWTNGDGNVFLVGGWCWDGMVLLEGCIVSAIRVAQGFGVDVPWDDNPRT